MSDDKLLVIILLSKSKGKKDLLLKKSKANTLRSIACYYSAGVMGKRKYQTVRLTSAMNYDKGKRTVIQFMAKCPIPKLLPYNKLESKIKSKIKEIDIGRVYFVEKEFSCYVEKGEKISGCYRDLREYLPCLAQFYLSVSTRSKLK